MFFYGAALTVVYVAGFGVAHTKAKCQVNEWKCSNEMCIPLDERCNNFPDCTDGSDEQNCNASPVCLEGLESCPQPNGTTVCVEKAIGCSCGSVPVIAYGKIVSVSNAIGSLALVTCDTGYDATSPSVTCQNSGLWKTALCIPKDCGPVPKISFGKVNLSDINNTKYGASGSVVCDTGYETSTPVIKCQESGNWDVAVCTVKESTCNADIKKAHSRACPVGLRDDGISCWKDSYVRGSGRTPDKTPCPSGTKDDGTVCWRGTYGRGAGRTPDKAPCPSGLRDDGTSCWSDAHIYGKGCCCTLWGCCGNCKTGYHDDGCTCRKTDVGIKMTLFDRQQCRGDEDKYGALCYPKCATGHHPVGCCICSPDDGAGVVKTLAQRQGCLEDEEMYGALCFPKCKSGFRSVDCCTCEPNEGPGNQLINFDRYYCKGHSIKFLTWCLKIENCSVLDLVRKFTILGQSLTQKQTETLKTLINSPGKHLN